MEHRITRPAEGSDEELLWLRGFEAGVIQTRADFLSVVTRMIERAEKAEAECKRLREALKFHPDVLSAHAQFGGDLIEMQHMYDAGEKS